MSTKHVPSPPRTGVAALVALSAVALVVYDPTVPARAAARGPTTPARSAATSPVGRSATAAPGKPRSTRETNVVTRLRYRGCATGLAVEHLRLAGVDHGWPSETWGLDTNEAVLRFFAAQVARSASVGDSRAARSAG